MRKKPLYQMEKTVRILHDKISEDEKDNSGVEAAHRTEEAGETVIARAGQLKQARYARRSNKVAALEKKQFKAEVVFRYQKYLEEHPEVKKKALQKRLQKQRIKREYAKALKKGSEAKQAAGYAKKAATTTTNMARKVEEFARKHIGAIATIGLFGLFFMLIAAGISSCSAVLNGGLSATMAGSYQSQPAQLDASDEAMTSREMALQNTIDSIEEDYPDYDEYNYNLEEIGHNPFTLINYLSAIKVDVVAADVDAEIESLRFSFKEMAESGNTVKDYIAPQGFEFRFPGRYKMGHMFGATKYLDIISPKLNDELLKRLLDIDSNISISIHMRTIEPTEAIKLLKRALSDVQKTKIDEQKKAVRAGYDMDILPTDIVLYEKNTMELLDDLNTSNQKLIWTTILISSFGRNKRVLRGRHCL